MTIDVQTSFELTNCIIAGDSMARPPGSIRDAIVGFLLEAPGNEGSLAEIRAAVARRMGAVSESSIRSYLNLNVPDVFERTGRGQYRLKKKVN